MSNQEDIEAAAEALRQSKSNSKELERRRNDLIGRQYVEERTPVSVLAEWSGLSPDHVSRLVKDYKKRNSIK